MPSDYDGVVYTKLDDAGGWKTKLIEELNEVGFAGQFQFQTKFGILSRHEVRLLRTGGESARCRTSVQRQAHPAQILTLRRRRCRPSFSR